MIAIIASLMMLLPAYPHTAEDVRLLGNTGWLENPVSDRNDQDQMDKLILTMAVVLNRMKSNDKWWHLKGEKTVYDVVFAPGQYAVNTKNKVMTTNAPDWVYELAEDMLNYGTNVPDYIIYQSMNSNLGTVWKRIGKEYFATGGGHKNEGDNFHPKVFGSDSRNNRGLMYLFGDTYNRVLDRATQIIRTWIADFSFSSCLGVSDELGGKGT